jgi:hypothetical protein
MARLLKTFLTSIGFFDLAVAAPSMKAALDAWGVRRNLFHDGVAWETDDPNIVKATMAKPGVVLKRAVGTKGAFQERADLPTELPKSATSLPAPRKAGGKRKSAVPSRETGKAQKAAIIQFDKEKARRERERAREAADRAGREAAETKKIERRQLEADRIQAQLKRARERHDRTLAEIQKKRDALDRKSDSEKRRWDLEKARLEDALKAHD